MKHSRFNKINNVEVIYLKPVPAHAACQTLIAVCCQLSMYVLSLGK
jgi:hypothetical protein